MSAPKTAPALGSTGNLQSWPLLKTQKLLGCSDTLAQVFSQLMVVFLDLLSFLFSQCSTISQVNSLLAGLVLAAFERSFKERKTGLERRFDECVHRDIHLC
jgi:hypothetical protein